MKKRFWIWFIWIAIPNQINCIYPVWLCKNWQILPPMVTAKKKNREWNFIQIKLNWNTSVSIIKWESTTFQCCHRLQYNLWSIFCYSNSKNGSFFSNQRTTAKSSTTAKLDKEKRRKKGGITEQMMEWKGIYANDMPICHSVFKYLYYIVGEKRNWGSVDLFAPKPWIKTSAGPLVPAVW